jgi:hypothetical protein
MPQHDIVVIGGSAGSLQRLTKILSSLPVEPDPVCGPDDREHDGSRAAARGDGQTERGPKKGAQSGSADVQFRHAAFGLRQSGLGGRLVD